MAFWHQLGTKPIGKRVLLLPEPRPGPPAEPKIICHPEAGNTKYIPLSGVNPPFPSSHAPCCPPQPRRSVRPRVGSRRSLDAQALREGPHLLCSCAPSHPGTGTPTASLLQPRCQGVGSGGPAMLLSGPGGCSKNTCFWNIVLNQGFWAGFTLYQTPRIFGQGQNP